MPDSTLFLDPAAGHPDFIKVGGKCYRRTGESAIPPDTSAYDSSWSNCECLDCACLEGATATTLSVTGRTVCVDQGDGTSIKYWWDTYDVALTPGLSCSWSGSPDTAPVNLGYSCSDSDCEDCSEGEPDTVPEDFGGTITLQTTPDCVWVLVIYGFSGDNTVGTETKPYDSGDPRGTYSGGSVVS